MQQNKEVVVERWRKEVGEEEGKWRKEKREKREKERAERRRHPRLTARQREDVGTRGMRWVWRQGHGKLMEWAVGAMMMMTTTEQETRCQEEKCFQARE